MLQVENVTFFVIAAVLQDLEAVRDDWNDWEAEFVESWRGGSGCATPDQWRLLKKTWWRHYRGDCPPWHDTDPVGLARSPPAGAAKAAEPVARNKGRFICGNCRQPVFACECQA